MGKKVCDKIKKIKIYNKALLKVGSKKNKKFLII